MIITLSQWIESVESRLFHLMKEVNKMLPEIVAVQESTRLFIAEVNADISSVLGAVKSLQDQIDVLKSQPVVSQEDLKSLSDLATQLNTATADVHSKTAPLVPAQAEPAPPVDAPADPVAPSEEQTA